MRASLMQRMAGLGLAALARRFFRFNGGEDKGNEGLIISLIGGLRTRLTVGRVKP